MVQKTPYDSYEDRMRTVELYIQFDSQAEITARALVKDDDGFGDFAVCLVTVGDLHNSQSELLGAILLPNLAAAGTSYIQLAPTDQTAKTATAGDDCDVSLA